MNKITELMVKSPSFQEDGTMPRRYTGFDADISPALKLMNLCDGAVSLAVIMDDLDIPIIKAYNHWTIWNMPPMDLIPENIPYGSPVPSLGGAVQGSGYGVNRYRGPKQPVFVRNTHRYIFQVYVLDCFLDLDKSSGKKELLAAMDGHVIQQGSVTGTYRRGM